MSTYILAIDQGTTSSRAILFAKKGKELAIHAIAQQEFPQHFPQDAWVEHDPNDLWQSVFNTCNKVLIDNKVTAKDILAIGITNQRETTLVWDRTTGEPIYNGIVWQDRRTAADCESLRSATTDILIEESTGLRLDPYFSATKIAWILKNVAGAREKAQQGQLAFGTVDSFLLWQLTGGKVHRTDATNASRTLLFNIHSQTWDQALLDLFDIPISMLPQVMDSAAHFGDTESALFGGEIPILSMAGDQQAALFGQACFTSGMAKITYGTGGFLMLNTGDQALKSENKLLTTVAYRLNGQPTYAIEGSIFNAGATIQWIRDGLRLIQNASETESIAQQVAVDHGVYLVPAFTGLGAPYWDPEARGAIVGLTRDSGIDEIVTAALQSVAYQTKDLQQAMASDGIKPSLLRVDGGMVVNNWLLHFLADILDISVDRPQITETTALGVAYLAALQLGIYQSPAQLASLWKTDQRFSPKICAEQRQALYQGWLAAVKQVQSKV